MVQLTPGQLLILQVRCLIIYCYIQQLYVILIRRRSVIVHIIHFLSVS